MAQSRAKRVALITGGNRGIGKEIARQIAEAGIHAVIAARDGDKGAAAASELIHAGLDVSAVELDVTNGASIVSAIAAVSEAFGPIEILVNNAAIMIDGPGGFDASLFDLSSDTMRKTWETNVIGPVALMQAVLPGMRARNFGRVVNMSSLAGQLAEMGAGFPAYRMSKAALNAATRVAAAEMRGVSNIKINAASPGWVKTDMGGEDAPRSVAEGADTAVWLAQLPNDGPTGGFFHDRRQVAW